MQFESIAGFGAIIDRLGQFTEVLDPYCHPEDSKSQSSLASTSKEVSAQTRSETSSNKIPDSNFPSLEGSHISVIEEIPSSGTPLMELSELTLRSPDGSTTLVEDITARVHFSNVKIIIQLLLL